VIKRSHWTHYKNIIGRIRYLADDWLTPIEYIPYIYKLLEEIDLDPCATHHANAEFIQAKKIYTLKEDGLNIQEPWKGKTYLFPPTYGRYSFKKNSGTWMWSKTGTVSTKTPSVIWFQRLIKEWKLRNIPEALFFTIYPEMMRVFPEMWDYPVCIPHKRCNLIHGKDLYTLKAPISWGYFVYLPKLEYGFQQADKFIEIFSDLGNIIY
jgi:hypothetical protein